MLENGQMTDFAKIILGQIISGTKFDTDELIFFCRKGGQ